MAATKRNTLPAQVSEHDLFDALVYVAQRDKYAIKGLSHEMREMLFTGVRTSDARGRVLAATVVREGDGSVLQMSVGTAPGTMPSFSDGRKNQAALDALIDEVRAALAAPEQSQPEAMKSFAVLGNGTTVPWTSGELPEELDED